MKISDEITRQTVFRAGLTPQVCNEIKKLDVHALEKEFANINVEANFMNNKAIGGICALAVNLLKEAEKKFSLPVAYLPPVIRVYDKADLLKGPAKSTGFCLTEPETVLINEKPFDVCSVFIKNVKDDINYIDNMADSSTAFHFSSTNHFTQYVLHELFHAIHLDAIFREKGYEGESEFAKLKYNNNIDFPDGLMKVEDYQRKFFPFNKIRIWKNIGRYASTSKMELYAETMTKIFTDCIDDNMSLKSNPMDELKKYPDFIGNFVRGELK